jgi:hypothetical protein
MTKITSPKFKRAFINVDREEADTVATRFEKAEFPRGYRGDWSVHQRKDSPDGSRVNLYLRCKKIPA